MTDLTSGLRRLWVRGGALGLGERRACHGFWLKQWSFVFLMGYAVMANTSAAPRIIEFSPSGRLAWTNALTPGVCTVEMATQRTNWVPIANAFSIAPTGQTTVVVGPTNQMIRLRNVEVLPTPEGFTNLVQAFGILETVCGSGIGRTDDETYWESSFEGGSAQGAALSRPHVAMADGAGNIFVADKNSHSILRVSSTRTLHTYAGTHEGGFNGEGPTSATNLQLNYPNALWVRDDGTVYVLDTDNARVRRVTTNGVMTTLFYAKNDPSSPLGGGRCLWVSGDETLAYFGNGDRLRKWTPSRGLETFSDGFVELGGFYVESAGSLVVADRGGHRVYRVYADGSKVVIAGTGATTGGGDGFPALQTGFNGPRGVWAVPTGGYLLLLHDGAQLWYVDAGNTARLLLNGLGGNGFVHAGDEEYFYAPQQYVIGEGRSVCMDPVGNIIICESDYGFVRRIRFQRFTE